METGYYDGKGKNQVWNSSSTFVPGDTVVIRATVYDITSSVPLPNATVDIVVGGAETVKGERVPWGQGIMGAAVQSKRPINVPNVWQDDRFYKNVDKQSGFVTKSIMCVPMQAGGHIIGVIELMNLRPDYMNDDGLRILTVIAEHGPGH